MNRTHPLLALVVSWAVLTPFAGPAQGQLQLVETFPVETDLDHADIPEAYEVWIEMIDGASVSLDLAQFYLSNEEGSRLEPVVQAIEAAADRGVSVRVLAENNFYKTYPQTLERLDARDRIEVRRFRVRDVMGGVLHAKYFIVDGESAFVGSQNFDWRALAHIQELGVQIQQPVLASGLASVFELDWKLAQDGAAEVPNGSGRVGQSVTIDLENERVRASITASPRDWLPANVSWDLPELLWLIDGSRQTLRLQLLSYNVRSRDGTDWTVLDDALRRAASRGVRVQLLLADWNKRPKSLAALKSLEQVDGIEVKMATIPPWSGGFIPYARVIHCKYLVADGRAAWIGTSNWEKSYFFTSRNVGLVVEGAAFAESLDQFFATGWDSHYSERVDPDADYEVPRIGE